MCCRFVMLFLIAFRIPWNSLIGPTILLSISSSSGTTDDFISSRDAA